jgi:hypothetical protein
MNQTISDIIADIRDLENKLEQLIAKQQRDFLYHFEGTKIKFETSIVAQQKAMKVGLIEWLASSKLRSILSIPFIYGMIVPLVLLHISIEIFHIICFSLYKIPKVKRADYFVADRHLLPYLNIIEKLNCAYCSYGNGVIAYTREIIGRIELYWCPIKHAKKVIGTHKHYQKFLDFGEFEEFHAKTKSLRKQMSKLDK